MTNKIDNKLFTICKNKLEKQNQLKKGMFGKYYKSRRGDFITKYCKNKILSEKPNMSNNNLKKIIEKRDKLYNNRETFIYKNYDYKNLEDDWYR